MSSCLSFNWSWRYLSLHSPFALLYTSLCRRGCWTWQTQLWEGPLDQDWVEARKGGWWWQCNCWSYPVLCSLMNPHQVLKKGCCHHNCVSAVESFFCVGLDSASSTELLVHLNALAASNRTVVLTIHQPRLEIFHMFHRIVVLSDGKVSEIELPQEGNHRYMYILYFLSRLPIMGYHKKRTKCLWVLSTHPSFRIAWLFLIWNTTTQLVRFVLPIPANNTNLHAHWRTQQPTIPPFISSEKTIILYLPQGNCTAN